MDISKVEWTGEKVTGKTEKGTLRFKEGTFTLKGGEVTGGTAVLDMTTIEPTSLTGDYKKKLADHLKSPDFFEVEKYPTATFAIDEVTSTEETKEKYTHQVTGNLTMKGITKEIEFPARIEKKEGKVFVYSSFPIDRSRWKIKYGSDSFFDDLGDKMILDEVKLQLKAVLE